ncbi:glycosyltransferase [Candidatus Omnitrophota bacterium]
MKKIIIFNASTALYGAERGLLHLIKALHHRFEITVVLPGEGALTEKIRNSYPSVEIKIFPLAVLVSSLSPLYYITFFLLSLINIFYFSFYIAAKGYDLVLTNSLILPLPCLSAKCAGKKHIWYVREFFSFGLANKVLSSLARKFSDRIICQSETIKNKLALGDKAEIVYEPLDDQEHRVYDSSEVRQELGLPIETKIITIISRIHPSKGQYRFLEESLARLKAEDDLFVLLVGDIRPGSLRSRLYKRRIRKLIRSNGLANVRLLGFREDVDKFYSLSDICVFPFERDEPFGIAVAEALSFGKLTFFPKRAGLKEVYEIFGMGSDYNVGGVFKAVAAYKNMPSPSPDTFYIPEILSFNQYASKLLTLCESRDR